MSPRPALPRDLDGLDRLRREHDDVLTRRQLRDLGITHHDIRREIGSRSWQPYGTKVVLTTAAAPTPAQMRRAAVRHAGPRALIAGLTALACHGLEGWDDERIHLVVPAGTHVTRTPDVVAHRTHRLPAEDATQVNGLPLTTAARSVLDAARWVRSTNTSAGVVYAAIQQRVTSPEEVGASLARFLKVTQKEAIAQAVAGAAAGADSLSEAVAAELMVLAGFDEPVRQLEIATSAGTRRVDLAVELGDGRLLVVEIDGPHHALDHVRVVDAVKDAALLQAGHHVVRIPADDVLHRRAAVLSMLRRLHAELVPHG